MRRRPIASIALFGAMALVYLVQFARSAVEWGVAFAFVEAPMVFLEQGAITSELTRGEWWRMLTALFLHAGMLHLLYNGWALLQFGSLLEKVYGAPFLLIAFFTSGCVASIASSLMLDVRYSVGASGAIFGVVGALIASMGSVKARRIDVVRALRLQIALWAAVTIIGGFMSEAIDNTAHVAGCIAGLAIGALRSYSSSKVLPTGKT